MAPCAPEPKHSDSPDQISPGEWAQWLQSQQDLAFREYQDRPGRLPSDSNGERSFVNDYAGREILELLQNANDAAANTGIGGRVRIEITSEGLIAANTGRGFSRKGVESLLLPHTSPKPSETVRVVGHKGLGFRALLNWTKTPLISSGTLSLAFTEALALQKQNALAELGAEIRQTLEQQQQLVGERVVPLLAFPAFTEDGDLTALLLPNQTVLYRRMLTLRTEGYTTVVGVPFQTQRARSAAENQIKALQPEILLFSGSLSEVIVSIDGAIHIHWTLDFKTRGTARIRIGADELRRWRLFHDSGEVPAAAAQSETGGRSRFEITLAIPTNHECQMGSLYSYFPTDVRFPFHLICHATLDLISNRQQIRDSQANRFILGRLAELLASTAEKLAGPRKPFAGLDLIAGDRTESDSLEKFGFSSLLIAAAREKLIVPTLAGTLVRAAAARRFHLEDTTWLPQDSFGTVAVVIRENEHRYTIQKLDVPIFTEWNAALKEIQFDGPQSRATFIAGMHRHGLSAHLLPHPILIDEKGKLVPVGHRVFLPPADHRDLQVPEGFDIRFLDPVLTRALMQMLERKDHDTLASILAPFGVTRYSLDTLVGSLAAEVNTRVKRDPDKEEQMRRELLTVLFKIYASTACPDSRPKFPREALVRVLTLTGSFEDVRALYFSSSYGPPGRLLQQLYGSFARESLVAAPPELGLETGPEATAQFLGWLGVAEVPRAITIEGYDIPGEFYSFIKASLPYPIKMEGELFHRPSEVSGLRFAEVTAIDRLDDILANAPAPAILAWLALDSRAVGWKHFATKHGKVGTRSGGQHRTRWYAGPIPSLIRWTLASTPWLPARNGKVLAPLDTVAEAIRGLEDLFPVPVRPSKAQFEEFGAQGALVRDALDWAGVVPAFAEIDVDRLYELLLSLPVRDPEGKLAKSVYRAVLEHSILAEAPDLAERDRFKLRGSIWARKDTVEKYVPIADVWHVDSEDIPSNLTRRLNVAALPKRSTATKVEKLFGIRTLTRDVIQRKVTSHQPVAEAEPFSDDVEALKPLIAALRRRLREPAQLRTLKIILCSKIEGEMEFQNEVIPLAVEAWGWVFDDATNTAYVQVDPNELSATSSPLLADALGQIFAAIFRVERGDDFARLVGCPRKDRLSLLRRLAGDEGIPNLPELEKTYRESRPADSGEDLHVPAAAQGPLKVVPASPPTPPLFAPAPLVAPSPPLDSPFKIEAVPHTPTLPAAIELRISQRISTGPRSYSGSNRVANGALCEVKALEFEQSDKPERFPVPVSNITGWKAPGVDLLSFGSAEARAAFLGGDYRDALVSRFIEVKGRSNEGAKIDLRNNELAAALKYKDRYYLYRLFLRGDGSYNLSVLQNPLADETAFRYYYEINLEAATRAKGYELTGGVTEATLAGALEAAAERGRK